MTATTLYDKIWDAHLVHAEPGEACVLYIDRHLVHEVTSPQAFEGLRMAGRGEAGVHGGVPAGGSFAVADEVNADGLGHAKRS